MSPDPPMAEQAAGGPVAVSEKDRVKIMAWLTEWGTMIGPFTI